MNDGSSPRSWGTVRAEQLYPINFRFIPTVVGNSDASSSGETARSVHPHGRGEQGNILDATGNVVRFIPTVVGNSRSVKTPANRNSVHPHGRGEQCLTLTPGEYPNGSSPRSWGTVKSGFYIRITGRFIPTVVGNSKKAPTA